jgi:hypothetical protein
MSEADGVLSIYHLYLEGHCNLQLVFYISLFINDSILYILVMDSSFVSRTSIFIIYTR